MALFHLTPVSAPPAVSHVQQVQAPRPPKALSDHKPENTATSSRGPAVVLSGGLAKAPDKVGQQAHGAPPATGQHINHVI